MLDGGFVALGGRLARTDDRLLETGAESSDHPTDMRPVIMDAELPPDDGGDPLARPDIAFKAKGFRATGQ